MRTYEEKYQKRKSIQRKIINRALSMKKPFFEDEGDDDIFEREMLGVVRGKKEIDVLEWGTGYSTKYYPDILKKKGIKFIWDSIEYDRRWSDAIADLDLPDGVTIYLFDEPILRIDDRRALRGFEMNDYVKYPSRIGRKYDLIFIDGTKRVRCLQEGLNLLKPDGIVILHDAQRVKYKEGMRLYNGQKLSEKLWKGKLKQ